MIESNGIEIYESEDGSARFYISYVSKECSTGIMILKPKAALPKHNRPNAIENLTQISGKCLMKLFDEDDNPTNIELKTGEGIRMPKDQYHIHSNPFNETSVTLWKAEGNIVEIIENIKNNNKKITTNIPKNLL